MPGCTMGCVSHGCVWRSTNPAVHGAALALEEYDVGLPGQPCTHTRPCIQSFPTELEYSVGVPAYFISLTSVGDSYGLSWLCSVVLQYEVFLSPLYDWHALASAVVIGVVAGVTMVVITISLYMGVVSKRHMAREREAQASTAGATAWAHPRAPSLARPDSVRVIVARALEDIHHICNEKLCEAELSTSACGQGYVALMDMIRLAQSRSGSGVTLTRFATASNLGESDCVQRVFAFRCVAAVPPHTPSPPCVTVACTPSQREAAHTSVPTCHAGVPCALLCCHGRRSAPRSEAVHRLGPVTVDTRTAVHI